MLKLSKMISGLFENYLSINGNQIRKGSMIAKFPRILCDAISEYGSKHPDDIKGIIDIGFDAVNSMLQRDRSTYYIKGSSVDLLNFIENLVSYINGNYANMRSIRNNEIIPLFKSEAVRFNDKWSKQLNEWKLKIKNFLKIDQKASKRDIYDAIQKLDVDIVDELSIPKQFQFLIKGEN